MAELTKSLEYNQDQLDDEMRTIKTAVKSFRQCSLRN